MKRFLKSGKPSEDLIQTNFFEWVFLQENVYPDLRLMHHIPNGGSRNIREAVKFKKMGVRKAIPDVFLPVPKGKYHGLYIEFKSADGEESTDQQHMRIALLNKGYFCVVCRESQNAIEITKKYLEI
jgi:hypothetical protein